MPGGTDEFDFGGWEEAAVPDENAVRERLEELGLPLDLLLNAVRAGQLARDFCTEAHPIYYPGSREHGETNGVLRGNLGQQGWTFSNENCIPRAISPDGKVVVTALSGDAQTGLRRGPDAQTRRPRRSGGLRLVRRNYQFVMAELLPEDDPELSETIEVGPTWFLLYYRDGDIVRSELSLATGVSDAGALLTWAERLILPEISMLGGPSDERDRGLDDGPDVDVPVERRTA